MVFACQKHFWPGTSIFAPCQGPVCQSASYSAGFRQIFPPIPPFPLRPLIPPCTLQNNSQGKLYNIKMAVICINNLSAYQEPHREQMTPIVAQSGNLVHPMAVICGSMATLVNQPLYVVSVNYALWQHNRHSCMPEVAHCQSQLVQLWSISSSKTGVDITFF